MTNSSTRPQRNTRPAGVDRRPAAWVFWGSLGVIAYTYVGFPLLLAARALLRPRPVRARPGQALPSVSMIIAAHNEAAIITDKLNNTIDLDYPRELLEVIVASDGSDDDTVALVAGYGSPSVRLLDLPRLGKNRTLNAAVAEAGGDILVFTDADTLLEHDALRRLVEPFGDPEVGGVGGDYRYADSGVNSAGERLYWALDRRLKALQSRAGNMTSATGQIYALRRSLFHALPIGVTDDFYISVQAPAAHRRLVFEPRARGHGAASNSPRREFRRKVRVMTAGLRAVWLQRRLLDPREYGMFALQLGSHKVLRRLMFVPVIGVGLSAPALWRRGRLYRVTAAGQGLFHLCALASLVFRGSKRGPMKALNLPMYFDLVNFAAVVALANLIRGERADQWETQRDEAAVASRMTRRQTGRATSPSVAQLAAQPQPSTIDAHED